MASEGRLGPCFQEELKLLRLENAFYRSCLEVRQSGTELQEVRSFLLRELWALEIDKRRMLDCEAEKKIAELQVCGCGTCFVGVL